MRPRYARPPGGHRLEVRGSAVVVDGCLRPVPPGPMAVLRALARRPGWVVSRADLLSELPGGGADEHAVEAAIARLRSGLGAPGVVQTAARAARRGGPSDWIARVTRRAGGDLPP